MPFDQVNFELPVITKPDTHLADILRAAWKAIEANGWRKVGSHAQGGWASMCAVQAVYTVGDYHHNAYLASRILDKAVPPAFAYCPIPSTAYNDHPDTTLADMRALFLRAIDLVGG